jgi:hypothetical protein
VRIDRQQYQQQRDDCDLVFAPKKLGKSSQPWDFVADAVHFWRAPHYAFDIPQARLQLLPQAELPRVFLRFYFSCRILWTA